MGAVIGSVIAAPVSRTAMNRMKARAFSLRVSANLKTS
jgi:hypothetical protein